jgi:TRAP transporter TAXI family solute receptor
VINKEQLKVFGPALLIVIFGFWVAYQFVEPAPPDTIIMSTGRKDGAYYIFAQQYRDILARSDITLKIRTSAGSLQNIQRLEAREADLAFVQGGTTPSKGAKDLVSLGSLYYEPLWVFYRGDIQMKRLTDLKGKKIAVGEKGSGTRPVALQLLKNNGISRSSAALSSLSGRNAANALLRGDLDAAFFIASPRSPVVHKLLIAKEIDLMTFERAEAYTRIHRYLSTVALPQGVIDLQKDIPDVDTMLVAATANLVVRTDFHPALIDLLLQTAKKIHGPGGLFEQRGEFPSPKYLAFPLSEEAERIYRRGPSFLRRYLPFWVATFVDRMIVMLIPFIALLIPLFRVLPPTYRWRMQSRIYRWYKEVKIVDQRAHDEQSTEGFRALLADLDKIEGKVDKISTPLPYADRLYTLRVHINLVRDKILKAMKHVTD